MRSSTINASARSKLIKMVEHLVDLEVTERRLNLVTTFVVIRTDYFKNASCHLYRALIKESSNCVILS
jgi:hypothetical protein